MEKWMNNWLSGDDPDARTQFDSMTTDTCKSMMREGHLF